MSLSQLWPTGREIFRGDYAGVSTNPEFAYALAALLVVTGVGFLAAFLLMHVIAISLKLRKLRRLIESCADAKEFCADYERVHQKFTADPLIGPAWRAFDATLIHPRDSGEIIRSTIRPQAFINLSAAREKLPGLELMGNIPGYYVGLGLLLTFIGLVFALHHAADAVNSQNADGMQVATRQLLQVATFKFATSIAGLGVSIVLSFFFRGYVILIESAFDEFDHALEKQVRYAAPQSIALEAQALMEEQAGQLKQINSEQFFSRMGEQMAPRIQEALSAAVAPMSDSINTAVSRMSETSQTGVENLIKKFSASVQGGAGQELRALAVTLDELRKTLADAQRGIHGSGEDFGHRMSEAAENLSRLIEQAAGRLDHGSEKSRAALDEIVAALRETFQETNDSVQQAVAQATGGAASRVQEMMSALFGGVEAQVTAFRSSVGDFEKSLGTQIDETRRGAATAQAASVEAVGAAAAQAAKALEQGLATTLQRINGEVAVFVTAMNEAKSALSAQAASLHDVAGKSRGVADAFHATAADLRLAATPLLQSGERIAQSTERLDASVQASVNVLSISQSSSRQLAEALATHLDQVTQSWKGYEEQFRSVDRDLANAFDKLREGSENLGQILARRVATVDKGLADSVDKLSSFVGGFAENVNNFDEALDESIKRLGELLPMRAAE